MLVVLRGRLGALNESLAAVVGFRLADALKGLLLKAPEFVRFPRALRAGVFLALWRAPFMLLRCAVFKYIYIMRERRSAEREKGKAESIK